ncbi:MAG: hypothetical protein RLZZ74_2464 [Cyanobacteriota bacterium]|jgi:hypothetical protein
MGLSPLSPSPNLEKTRNKLSVDAAKNLSNDILVVNVNLIITYLGAAIVWKLMIWDS